MLWQRDFVRAIRTSLFNGLKSKAFVSIRDLVYEPLIESERRSRTYLIKNFSTRSANFP